MEHWVWRALTSEWHELCSTCNRKQRMYSIMVSTQHIPDHTITIRDAGDKVFTSYSTVQINILSIQEHRITVLQIYKFVIQESFKIKGFGRQHLLSREREVSERKNKCCFKPVWVEPKLTTNSLTYFIPSGADFFSYLLMRPKKKVTLSAGKEASLWKTNTWRSE